MTPRTILICCTLLLAAAPGPAPAAPITYTFTGSATGQLEDTPFADRPFQLTGHSDTSNIYENSTYPIYHGFLYLGATFDIDGVGQGSFLDSSVISVFNNYDAEFLAFRRFASSDIPSFLALYAPGQGLDTWDHTTSIGPISGNALAGGPVPGGILQTTVGDLYFSVASEVVFEATVVPLPPALLVFASGLLVVSWTSRFRPRS